MFRGRSTSSVAQPRLRDDPVHDGITAGPVKLLHSGMTYGRDTLVRATTPTGRALQACAVSHE
jgi:hypothetical protein